MATVPLPADLLKELHRPHGNNGVRLATFVALYGVAGGCAYLLQVAFPHQALIYLACLPIYLLAAAALHGISLFTHEAVHGTLSRKRICNDAVGAVCAWPVLQNFAAYKVLHL